MMNKIVRKTCILIFLLFVIPSVTMLNSQNPSTNATSLKPSGSTLSDGSVKETDNGSKEVSQSQKFIMPETLWKAKGQCLAKNVIIRRLPNSHGSIDVGLSRYSDSDSTASILTGNICDMVKGYNNSSFVFGKGQFLIQPPEGSDEQTIEINSLGLNFIYHSGIGLEYISGQGSINMFGTLYELPPDEWKVALKKDSIEGYREYVKNNPAGEHIQDANTKIEDISYQQCFKNNRYFGYHRFFTEFPASKKILKVKAKLNMYTKYQFLNDMLLPKKMLIQKYNWNSNDSIFTIDDQGFGIDIDNDGKTWVSGNFAFGNLELINARATRIDDALFVTKGTALVYKAPPVTKSPATQQKRIIKK
jgi:hypothetical protein